MDSKLWKVKNVWVPTRNPHVIPQIGMCGNHTSLGEPTHPHMVLLNLKRASNRRVQETLSHTSPHPFDRTERNEVPTHEMS